MAVVLGFMLVVGTVVYSADAPNANTSPSPSPSITPHVVRGGPITLGVTGNLVGGQQVSNSTGAAGAQTTSQSTSTSNAGALLDVARRTASTASTITLPASISGHGADFGQVTTEYDTSYASWVYGSQPISAIGLVPIGTLTRGSTIVFPRRHGDIAFFAGAATGTPSYVVEGARLRFTGAHDYGAITAYDATAAGGGRVDGIVAGLATSQGRLSAQLEAGISSNVGVTLPNGDAESTIPNGTGVAVYGRLDDGVAHSYTSLIVRDLSPNFVTLGGLAQADQFAGLTYRSQAGSLASTTIVENDRSGDFGSVTDTQTESYLANAILPHGANVQLSLTDQDARSGGDLQWSGTGNLGVSLPSRFATATLTLDAQRTTDLMGAPQANILYQLGLTHAFAGLALSAQAAVTRQTGQTGLNASSLFTLSATRTVGKTGYALSVQGGNQLAPGSALRLLSPTLSVTRRVSNALFVTANAAMQYRHDAIDAANDGRSLQFSFSVGAPFSFGNGVTTGRADPRLPGTISGIVQANTSVPGLPGQAQVGGSAANIAVILDNQQVVRTDLQGRFQFSFLPAGRHQLTIDPASLPRGTQPAMPITSINLLGGQVSQVVLAIGAFGSVEGSVDISLGNGQTEPISGVTVVLDGQTRIVTDQNGAFAFGGLDAGKHTIALVPETFPASFVSGGQNTQSVNIVTGEMSRVTFSGAPLGSITGHVRYDTGQPKAGAGVNNAYVVAQPGNIAVITDETGAFFLDNMPAGNYTLSVDPETLEDGLGATTQDVPVELRPGAKVADVDFRIAAAEKGVVFSFKGSETNVVTARAVAPRTPPGGSSAILVHTSLPVTRVSGQFLNVTIPFTYRSKQNDWIGIAHFPAFNSLRTINISIDAEGKNGGSTDVNVVLDPSLPIATFTLMPANPVKGQYVHVRAHLFVDAAEGNKIIWQDGSVTTLPAPRAGRYFEFDVKVGAIPYRGTLLTPSGQVAVTLVR